MLTIVSALFTSFIIHYILSEIPAFAGKTELVLWDGRTTAAEIASEGTYFYSITFYQTNGEVRKEKGTVTLLR